MTEKKKIKRKKGGKSKPYFGKEVQAFIVEHQNLSKEAGKFLHLLEIRKSQFTIDRYVKNYASQHELNEEDVNIIPEDHRDFLTEEDCNIHLQSIKLKQDKIYKHNIQPAFDKLVENLIFIHSFLGHLDSYEDLKSDCISFLYQAIPKFKHEKGTKAFSYFNIVAKHYLIIRSKIRASKIKRNVSLDDPDAMGTEEMETLQQAYLIPSPDDIVEQNQFIYEIYELLNKMKTRTKNDYEEKCVNAIEDIFINMEDLEFLNKRAVFQYIRDHSGLSAKQLTTTMSVVKKYWKEIKRESL